MFKLVNTCLQIQMTHLEQTEAKIIDDENPEGDENDCFFFFSFNYIPIDLIM